MPADARAILDRASSALKRSGSKSTVGRKSVMDSETSDDAAELNVSRLSSDSSLMLC